MKIIMVASECNPLCKTGGLADVIYSLSRELVQNGHDVTVFLPYYKQLKNKGLNAEYKYHGRPMVLVGVNGRFQLFEKNGFFVAIQIVV